MYQNIFIFFYLQENLLLDEDQNLKLIDFGLCAKPKVNTFTCFHAILKKTLWELVQYVPLYGFIFQMAMIYMYNTLFILGNWLL